jgi:hypothetical protein
MVVPVTTEVYKTAKGGLRWALAVDARALQPTIRVVGDDAQANALVEPAKSEARADAILKFSSNLLVVNLWLSFYFVVCVVAKLWAKFVQAFRKKS